MPYEVAGKVYDIDYTSCREDKACNTFVRSAVTSRSHHHNLVHVLFMDGHTRPVSNSINFATWRAIGTRNGDEHVDEY